MAEQYDGPMPQTLKELRPTNIWLFTKSKPWVVRITANDNGELMAEGVVVEQAEGKQRTAHAVMDNALPQPVARLLAEMVIQLMGGKTT